MATRGILIDERNEQVISPKHSVSSESVLDLMETDEFSNGAGNLLEIRMSILVRTSSFYLRSLDLLTALDNLAEL